MLLIPVAHFGYLSSARSFARDVPSVHEIVWLGLFPEKSRSPLQLMILFVLNVVPAETIAHSVPSISRHKEGKT